MKIINCRIVFEEYNSSSELTNEDSYLLEQAIKSAENAYAPYSLYKVGAAVLLSNGKIITGNNQENVAYPSGLCAERVALFYASSNYPGVRVKAIAITAKARDFIIDTPVTPCGACRQVMAEIENRQQDNIRVIMGNGKGKVWISEGINQLLPLMFRAEELKK